MRTFLASIIGFALLLVGAGRANAEVIFNNGAPDLVNAHHSDFDDSSPTDTAIVGDDFTLSGGGLLNAVRWFGVYAFDNIPPAVDDFTIRVFHFDNLTPDTNPFASFSVGAANRVATGLIVDSTYDLYQYDAMVPELALAPGRYFLSIVNDTTGTESDWYWADSGLGDAFQRDPDTARWAPYDGRVDLAFSLSGTAVVPEPSSAVLIGLASPLVLLASRRRHRRPAHA